MLIDSKRAPVRPQVLSLLALLILISVQVKLIYNTYELRNKEYFLREKGIINRAYVSSIRNDKLFPGGRLIIDTVIYKEIDHLEAAFRDDASRFRAIATTVCKSLFEQTRKGSSMDSLFRSILSTYKLADDLRYSLIVDGISVNFNGRDFIPLFNPGDLVWTSDLNNFKGIGMRIDGDLKKPERQSLTTSLNISADSGHSYQMSFKLYVDHPARFMGIVREMLPMLLLAVFSIVLIILIYYRTYKNWLKQKTLSEMQADFLNSIRHEFNTPITTIMVANKNIENSMLGKETEFFRSCTQIVNRQAMRLKLLVTQVLADTSSQSVEMDVTSTPLDQVTQEVVSDYKIQTSEGVEIQFKAGAGRSSVSMNKFLFTTLINNLLDNAVKHNNATRKIILVKTEQLDNSAILSVEDNGVGISRDDLEKIFNKFFKRNTRKYPGGLGLGLYYVKRAVIAHGWNINVESAEGAGTTFLITFKTSQLYEA